MIDYQSQKLHTKLSTFLKFMVFRIISQIKRAPMQVEVTDENQSSGEAPISTGRRRRPVPSNTEAGNTLFSFEIPEDITKMIDMDKLPHLELPINLAERTLSFKERLEGWNIERRQCETGRCDVYYRHKKSKRVLRSIYEIVIFLMYERCPTSRKRKSSSLLRREEEGQNGDEEKIWGNDSEDSVELYKKLEDEAAEALISLCDDDNDSANNNEDKPPLTTVDIASSSLSSSPVANDDDDDAIDLINHIPICNSMEELEEFLIKNRKFMYI